MLEQERKNRPDNEAGRGNILAAVAGRGTLFGPGTGISSADGLREIFFVD